MIKFLKKLFNRTELIEAECQECGSKELSLVFLERNVFMPKCRRCDDSTLQAPTVLHSDGIKKPSGVPPELTITHRPRVYVYSKGWLDGYS